MSAPRPIRLRRAALATTVAGVTAYTARRVRSNRRYRTGLVLPVSDDARVVAADDGVLLHVEEDGDPGAPVVVLFSHGFTARLEEFDLQREALRDRARLVFYDQRGHGRSAWGDIRHATIDQAGRDLGSVLDAVDTDRPIVLVGHSMGGMSIMSMLRQRPDELATRVAGLGLIATSAAPEDTDPLARVTLPLTRLHLLTPYLSGLRRLAPLLEAVRSRGTSRGRRFTRLMLFGADDVSPELLDDVQAMLEETPLPISAAFFPTFIDHDDRSVLPLLGQVPSVVIVGTDDRLTPESANRRIAETAGAASELVVVPGAGHSVNATRPDIVNAALIRLLDRVEHHERTRTATN